VERAEARTISIKSFRTALAELTGNKKEKAKKVLLTFSDPTTEPIVKAPGQRRSRGME